MKMMALEEAKEYTRQKLAPYYSNERIENVVKQYVSVVRPGVVLVEIKCGTYGTVSIGNEGWLIL